MATEKLERAFDALFDRCLEVQGSDEVVIAYDESVELYSDALVAAVCKRQLQTSFVFIPKAYQLEMTTRREASGILRYRLPETVRAAISASTVVLNVLDGDLRTLPVRRAIIREPRPLGCRLAHIPGISDKVLSILAESPFDEINEMCELVAWTLGGAEHAELTTYDVTGRSHVLNLDLGGWANEPMMSPGVIGPGSWGNVPPGETFCCPAPDGIDGSICIDGSVPGIVLSADDAIILTFERGRMISWRPVGKESPAQQLFDSEKEAADARSDHNWNVFAELGIGLNPVIRQLTGNGLFDEKAIETVHIAIGDNSGFGHKIEAGIHADLVACRPTLKISAVDLLTAGHLQREEWLRRRRQWTPSPIKIDAVKRFVLKTGDVALENGCLVRRLSKGGRVNTVQMADPVTGRQLGSLSEILKNNNNSRLADIFERHPEISGRPTDELLSILLHYHCIELF
jgi:aminopeptidase